MYEYCLDIWHYGENKQLKVLREIASGGIGTGVGQRLWFSSYAFDSITFFFLNHHMYYVDQNIFLKEKFCKS